MSSTSLPLMPLMSHVTLPLLGVLYDFNYLLGKQNVKHLLRHRPEKSPILYETINNMNVKIKVHSIVTARSIFRTSL